MLKMLIKNLLYSVLVSHYEKIESQTQRLENAQLLSELFIKMENKNLDKLVYLTQGKLHPDWMGFPEIGLSEKSIIKAIMKITGYTNSNITEKIHQEGDVGEAFYRLIDYEKNTLSQWIPDYQLTPLTVNDVYDSVNQISKHSGKGSLDKKLKGLINLLKKSKPEEAKYILRTITGDLRLGIGDATIIEALVLAYCSDDTDKSDFKTWISFNRKKISLSKKEKINIKNTLNNINEKKELLERFYSITSDLGYISKTLSEKGIKEIKNIKVQPTQPIRVMTAQRYHDPKNILEKMDGKVAAEWKLDGERFQIHKLNDTIEIFSRRLENITFMYPDIVDLIKKNIKTKKVIVEGEAVAVDPITNELQNFQFLMKRKRKHNIDKIITEVPVSLYLFDCLYEGDKDLTQKPYTERRKILEKIIHQNHRIKLVPQKYIHDPNELNLFFNQAIENGCEGLMLKSVSTNSIYRSGARSWLWIKWKRSYETKLVDSLDLVIVGAFMGRGKRTGKYGTLLVATYNKKNGQYETLCKVGSGFTDNDLDDFPKILDKYKIKNKDISVFSMVKADIWFKPSVVIEIIGDEFTLSPIHTTGFNMVKPNNGLAVRFPRFTGKWRFDKSAIESTSQSEILQMYKKQFDFKQK